MPANIYVEYLGEAEKEKELRIRLREFFKGYTGNWIVNISGDQRNSIWQAKIMAPDGRGEWVHQFYWEDGGHGVEKILQEISRYASDLRDEPKAE